MVIVGSLGHLAVFVPANEIGDWPVDFDSFQKVLNRPGGFRDPGEPEEYCRGFQVFDKDMTGFIGVGQLRYSTVMLTSHRIYLGSKFTDTGL